MWKSMLGLWAVAISLVNGSRILEEDRVRTDLVALLPFDVQLAMTGPTENINVYALTDIITDWMTDSFTAKSANQALMGNATTFESLGLVLRVRRNLQEAPSIQLFTASFDGVTLWQRRGTMTPPMNPEIVELIQRATFLEDNQLLPLLRSAQPYTGLGDTVVDVRAYVASPTTAPVDDGDDEQSDNLEIIIIVAIVVACLAFALLMFAVVWAWRTDQNKRETYSKGDRVAARIDVPTGSEESDNSPTGMTPPAAEDPRSYGYDGRPPTEIGSSTNDYPDSVISEDISTSLTAYYRSGMAGYTNSGGAKGSSAQREPRELNDAASMSSMDSYGYSLDGYAPSLGPAPQGYPIGPFNGMVKDPDTDYSEDEGTTFTKEDDDQ